MSIETPESLRAKERFEAGEKCAATRYEREIARFQLQVERLTALRDSDKSCGELSADDCTARWTALRGERDALRAHVAKLSTLLREADMVIEHLDPACPVIHPVDAKSIRGRIRDALAALEERA